MKELVIEAKTENLNDVIGFVDTCLEEAECPIKIQMQVDIAVEEIYVNIAHYAYTPNVGKAEISVDITRDPDIIKIVFADSGVPFDPLQKPDPDVTLSADERQVGGLGIFMVKKTMDDISSYVKIQLK